VVFQVKVDAKKLSEFIQEATPGRNRRNRPMPREEVPTQAEDKTEVAASAPQSWDGVCLLTQEEPQVASQP
jgi:hypothetical protein